MFLYVRNVLMSVNNIYHVRKVSPYIPLSVNTSTTLARVFHNVRHVQHVLISSMFLCHRSTQFLLRFCLIRFPLISQQKLFQFVIYLALSLYFY